MSGGTSNDDREAELQAAAAVLSAFYGQSSNEEFIGNIIGVTNVGSFSSYVEGGGDLGNPQSATDQFFENYETFSTNTGNSSFSSMNLSGSGNTESAVLRKIGEFVQGVHNGGKSINTFIEELDGWLTGLDPAGGLPSAESLKRDDFQESLINKIDILWEPANFRRYNSEYIKINGPSCAYPYQGETPATRDAIDTDVDLNEGSHLCLAEFGFDDESYSSNSRDNPQRRGRVAACPSTVASSAALNGRHAVARNSLMNTQIGDIKRFASVNGVLGKSSSRTAEMEANSSTVSLDGPLYPPINGSPAAPSISDPNVSVILMRDSMMQYTHRDIGYTHIFLNCLDPITLSQASPYLDAKLVLKKSPLTQGAQTSASSAENQTQAQSVQETSLYRFLNGSNFDSRHKDYVLSLPIGLQAEMGLSDDDVNLADLKLSVNGMEMFSSPQTLISADGETEGSKRNAPILDKFLPLMSLTEFEVNVTPAGGPIAHKTAKLSIVLHDRSRLADIAQFIRPNMYGHNQLLIEWGWSHPGTSPAARFINNLRQTEKFQVYNSTFTFGDAGEVNIELELTLMPLNELDQALVTDNAATVQTRTQLQRTLEIINQHRRFFRNASGQEDTQGNTWTNSVASTRAAASMTPEQIQAIRTYITQLENTIGSLSTSSDEHVARSQLKDALVQLVGSSPQGSGSSQIQAFQDNILVQNHDKVRLLYGFRGSTDPFFRHIVIRPSQTQTLQEGLRRTSLPNGHNHLDAIRLERSSGTSSTAPYNSYRIDTNASFTRVNNGGASAQFDTGRGGRNSSILIRSIVRPSAEPFKPSFSTDFYFQGAGANAGQIVTQSEREFLDLGTEQQESLNARRTQREKFHASARGGRTSAGRTSYAYATADLLNQSYVSNLAKRHEYGWQGDDDDKVWRDNYPVYVSLGKLFMLYVVEPLIASAKYEEIQVVFYNINRYASYVRDFSIAEFPIPTRLFQQEIERRLRGTSVMTVRQFISFVGSRYVSTSSADAYGLSDMYDIAQGGGRTMRIQDIDSQLISRLREQRLIDAYSQDSDDNRADQDLVFRPPQLMVSMDATPLNGDPSKTLLKIHIYDQNVEAYSDQGELLQNSRNDRISALRAEARRSAGSSEAASRVSLVNKVIEAGIFRPVPDIARAPAQQSNEGASAEVQEEAAQTHGIDASTLQAWASNGGRLELVGGFDKLKNFIKQTMPSITYGSEYSPILSAQMSSDNSSALASIQMMRGVQGSALTAPQLIDRGAPITVSPTSLSLETVGYPFFRFTQQLFFDFGTGTTVDNIYAVSGITHRIKPGEFTTNVETVLQDGFGKYEGTLNQLENAILTSRPDD